MKILYFVLGVIVVLALAVYLFTLLVFNASFRRVKNRDASTGAYLERLRTHGFAEVAERIGEGIDWIRSQPCEELHMKSRDGLELFARFIRSGAPAGRIAVLVHGYHGMAEFDFSTVARFYSEHGFDILLPDQRTHGRSEGKYITFGSYERYDIVDWCRFIDNKTGGVNKLLLNGVSMGCTTALLAAAEPDMPQSLRYVVADCGYTSPASIFNDVFHARYRIPAFPVLNLAALMCRLRAKFSFNEFSTTDAVKKFTVPILFLHGEDDKFVNIRNTRDNFEACTAPKELITVPGAGHGLSYVVETERCNKRLEEIFADFF